jgi:hypothetical protein
LPHGLAQVDAKDGKAYYNLVDVDVRWVYTEAGERVVVVYDEVTGLLECRYGRVLNPLDVNMKFFELLGAAGLERGDELLER